MLPNTSGEGSIGLMGSRSFASRFSQKTAFVLVVCRLPTLSFFRGVPPLLGLGLKQRLSLHRTRRWKKIHTQNNYHSTDILRSCAMGYKDFKVEYKFCWSLKILWQGEIAWSCTLWLILQSTDVKTSWFSKCWYSWIMTLWVSHNATAASSFK